MANTIKVLDTPEWIPLVVWVPSPPEWCKLNNPQDQTTGYGGGVLGNASGQLIMAFLADTEAKNT